MLPGELLLGPFTRLTAFLLSFLRMIDGVTELNVEILIALRHRSGKNRRRLDSSVEINGALVKWCVGELKIFNHHFTNSPIKRSFHVPFR